MKYFKNTNNTVFAYAADGSQDHVIPEDLIAITSEQADAITNPAPTLADAKSLAYAAIDAQAGRTRSKYITDVAGQPETYLLKAADAKAYKAAGYPAVDIAAYPMVRAEARALYGAAPTGVQCQLACDYIIGTQEAWLLLAADIEESRRTGNKAVSAITVAADATAAQIVLAVLAVNDAKQIAITALEAL